jgi:hypothetical protein
MTFPSLTTENEDTKTGPRNLLNRRRLFGFDLQTKKR